MQKLALLTVIPIIEKISFANANAISQIFRNWKLTLTRESAN